VLARTHPDLTWIGPQGANGEVLVEDVRDRVVAAVPMTPFEASRRVFVIEGADRMNESAANALLKTLEEPPAHAHLILIADSTGTVLPTILSRCQAVRFDAASIEDLAARLELRGIPSERALQCARLADGDGERAAMYAGPFGDSLRSAGEQLASEATGGSASAARPWDAILSAAAEIGKAAGDEVQQASLERIEFAARSEKSRIERDAEERAKRARRRAGSSAVDLALHTAQTWLRDLHRTSLGAGDLIPDSERSTTVAAANKADPAAAREAIELVEGARRALKLNVNPELAIESLAHELEGVLS
jgi:DNA polymerase-3 subunit delta'